MTEPENPRLQASTKKLLLISAGLVATAALTTAFFIWLGTDRTFAYFNAISISGVLLAIIFFIVALKRSTQNHR